MRVIAGRLRGRRLQAPPGTSTRPTSDRVREALFSMLGDVQDASVLDLFAGTGALGIEALSRGARFAMFVDNGTEARALLRSNIEAMGLGGATKVWRADATRLGKAPAGGPFGLAFVDPPYGQNLAGPALNALVEGGWLEPSALIVVEEAAKAAVATPEGLELVDGRTYGDTQILILARSGPVAAELTDRG